MFSDLTNSKVTLVKKDGTEIKAGIPAVVSPGKVIIFDTSNDVGIGDHFLRQLPGGDVEDFVVTESGFQPKMLGIPSSYQARVTRSDAPAAPPQTVINNIHNSTVGVLNTGTVGQIAVRVSTSLPATELKQFIEELKDAVQAFPEQARPALTSEIDVINGELTRQQPSTSKVKESLLSIKKIAEGTATGLVVKGVIAAATHLLTSLS